jgi:hypothetical protein
MCTWLQKNHKRFEKRSVESLQALITRKIEKLKDMQLVREIGSQPIKTATGLTSIYAFDATSYVLGWLIESLNPNPIRKSEAINKIFNILDLMLETDAFMSIFLKSLIRKMKENDLFTCLVDYMIELLKSSNDIKDISDLINQTFMFKHTDLSIINKYNELWEKTLNELEPRKKQFVMFRIKLYYEQRMKEKARAPAEFERARFSARGSFDKIVLEYGCLFCPHITYEAIDLIEYTIRLRYHIEGFQIAEKDCPSCNKTGSLQIIDL